jgi:carbonic anhydrase
VLRQLGHLKTYPLVRERVEAGQLRLHGWWFELKNADVYAYEDDAGHFVLIDDKEAERLLKRLAS